MTRSVVNSRYEPFRSYSGPAGDVSALQGWPAPADMSDGVTMAQPNGPLHPLNQGLSLLYSTLSSHSLHSQAICNVFCEAFHNLLGSKQIFPY